MARPKKYIKKRQPVQLFLFEDTISWLDDEVSNLNEREGSNIKRTELIQNIILQANMKLAKETSLKLSQLQSQIAALRGDNKNLTASTKDYISALNRRIDRTMTYYSDLPEPDEIVKTAFDKYKETFREVLTERLKLKFKDKFSADKGKRETYDAWIKMVLAESEAEFIKKSKNITKKNLVEKMIMKFILELEDELLNGKQTKLGG